MVTFNCDYCHKEVTRKQHTKVSYSGNRYCSQRCAAYGKNQIKDYSGEKAPNYQKGHTIYRGIAFHVYGKACTVCGYSIKDVLEVHHRDGNRDNNKASNLDVLCPTHHKEFELGYRTYPARSLEVKAIDS